MKYKEFNKKIIELVGGKGNIQSVVHCMTRLRFTLKDRSKAKTDELKEADLVLFNTCCVRENAEEKLFGKIG